MALDKQDELKEGFKNLNINDSIERVDALLKSKMPSTLEKIGFSLGIRLALGMASEIKNAKPLGSETGELIAGWIKEHGQAPVEEAIQTARTFLTSPDRLKSEMESKLKDAKMINSKNG